MNDIVIRPYETHKPNYDASEVYNENANQPDQFRKTEPRDSWRYEEIEDVWGEWRHGGWPHLRNET